MAWKTSDFSRPETVEQATAAPGERRHLSDVWIYDRANDPPTEIPGACPNCGSDSTYYDWVNTTSFGARRPTWVRGASHCQDCAGPDAE